LSWLVSCTVWGAAAIFAADSTPAVKEQAESAETAASTSAKTAIRSDSQPETAGEVNPASFQPQPPVLPPQQLRPPTAPARAQAEVSALWLGGLSPSLLELGAPGSLSKDYIFGAEAWGRATTDAGSLLDKSPAALGLGVQRRTPIVNDPRVRGGRVGQLAASGSYWVPARIDLDTALSKIDSRQISSMEVIKGPYSVMDGPGFHFVDVELMPSPRFKDGFETHGSTGVDYKLNGQQWYGRQALWMGDKNWGARFSYGHRTGNDYTTGFDTEVPSSYKSRDADLALGFDTQSGDHVEFNYLRLDQTDVEYPGQAFDIDVLVTDGYELSYVSERVGFCDQLDTDMWYNRTWFNGSAQRPGKRQQFPIYNYFRYVGFTDVDSLSTGFSTAASWGDDEANRLTAGVDLRYVKQELNEIASGRIGFNVFRDANSPIPRSQVTNPGVFVQQSVEVTDKLSLVTGARADYSASEVLEDPANLQHLGLQQPQSSFAEIVGTDQWDREVGTWLVFLNSSYALDEYVSVLGGVGHGERPASLTELYACQSFMFLLQNGLNSITGDPRLDPERVTQFDLGLQFNYPRLRMGLTGFYALAEDYITLENMNVFRGPPAGNVVQENLKYVNTDLATFIGTEAYGEYDLTSWCSPFATLRYVEGVDETRDGEFATRRASAGSPSERVYGLERGYFSGISGDGQEPLPGIPPLESRVGLRWHEPQPEPDWTIEFSARMVDSQDLVAESLLETPTPGFTIFDLRAFWRATSHLYLTAGIENIFDRAYREHLDFRNLDGIAVYQPGRTTYFGGELVY